MKKRNCISLMVVCVMFMLLSPVSALASGGGLVSLLTDQLGVTTSQAEGGAGTIFKAAKENMKEDDFAAMAAKVPEATSLLDKAPVVSDEKSNLIKGASSLLGDAGSKVNSANEIVEGFKKLGLDEGMVQKFTPIITDYVKEKAGEMSMELLKSALSF
jgi:hypothetical protein